jgi:quercetin dioxygenase-like cupin family protein
VAGALQVSIAEFLDPGTVIRRALPPEHGEPTVAFHELRLSPQARQTLPGNPHSGQKNLVVAQGTLELTLNDELIVLNTGDSILFSTEQPHTCHNPRDSEAVAYLVTSPAQVQE